MGLRSNPSVMTARTQENVALVACGQVDLSQP